MDCIWLNLKNVGVYTCIKMSFTQLEIILSCYVAMRLGLLI